YSGKNNIGSVTGATISTGRFGNGRSFNGTSDYVTISNEAQFDFTTKIFSFEAWVNINDLSADQVIFSKYNSFASDWSYHLLINQTTGKLEFIASETGAQANFGHHVRSLGQAIVPNQWHHVALTGNGSTISIVVNGSSLETESFGDAFPASFYNSSQPVRLGSAIDGVGSFADFFKGTMDEVRISNIARDPSEFNLQLPPVGITALATGLNIDLNWSNGGGGVPFKKYFIYRGADSTTLSLIDSTIGTSYNDNSGLTEEQQYFYRIAAQDSTGFEGAQSFAVMDTTQDIVPPNAPILYAADAGNGSINLKWSTTSAVDVVKYRIYLNSVLSDSTVADTDTTKTISGLANNAAYLVAISAVDNVGNESVLSNGMYATPTSPQIGQYAADANTSLLMHLNENAGTISSDYSGKNNYGTVTGAAVGLGRFASARSFNGTSDRINIQNSTALNNASHLSLESWVYVNDTTKTGRVIIRKNNGVNELYSLYLFGTQLMWVSTNTSPTTVYSEDFAVSINKWSHIAVTFNSSSQIVSFYVNGKFVGQQSGVTGTIGSSADELGIGANPTGSSSFFDGLIDEVRISNIARDPSTFNLQLPPVNLTAAATGLNIDLNWSNGGGGVPFKKYFIYRGADSTTLALIDSTTGTSYTDNGGLTEELQYFYKVTSQDSTDFEGAQSFAAMDTTQDIVPPNAPSLYSVTAGNNALDVQWSKTLATDVVKYRIYLNAILTDSTANDTDTAKVVTGLTNGTAYVVTVSAVDNVGNESIVSNSKYGTPTAPLLGQYSNDANTQLLLHLNENSGTVASDYSGKNNIGSVTGATISTGRFGDARNFSGTTQYLLVNNDPSLSPGSSFTAEAWINPTSVAGVRNIIHKIDATTGYTLRINNGKLEAWSGISSSIVSVASVLPNAWTHVAVSYDGIDATLFINGVQDSQSALSLNLNNAENIFIGQNSGGAGLFAGMIDEVRISNIARDPMTFNLQRPPTSLTALATGLTIDLNWSNGGGGVPLNYYRVYEGSDSSTVLLVDSTANTSLTRSGLLEEKEYAYKVTAVDSTGYESAVSFSAADTTVDLIPPASPTTLAATPFDGYVDLTWDVNGETDFAKYYIYSDTSPNPTTIVDSIFNPNTSFVTRTVLTNYTEYYFRVTAVDTNGNMSGFSNEVNAMPIDLTPPNAPQNLAADAGDSEVSVWWSPNTETDFSRYYVYGDTVSNAIIKVDTNFTISDTTALITGLTNYKTYYFHVTAVDTNGNESVYIPAQTAQPVDLTPPTTPTIVSSTPIDSAVILSWNAISETDFRVYYIYAGTSPNPTTIVDSVFNVNQTSSTISGLSNYSQYYFRLAARDTNANLSSPSNEVAATPIDLTAPEIPVNLVAVPGDGSISLSWDANTESDFAKYYVYADTAANPLIRIDSIFVIGNSLSTLSGLTNYVQYYFRVTSVDTSGNESNYSNEVNSYPVDLTPPAVPQNLVAADGDGIVSLKWSANTESDFASYTVYGDTLTNPVAPVDVRTTITDTTSLVTSLTNYTQYFYRLTAKDTSGNESAYSIEVTAIPHDTIPPAAPQNVTAIAGDGSATVQWNQNTEGDFKKYYVYGDYSSSPGIVIDSIFNISDTLKVYSGLTNYIPYYLRLSAVDTIGNQSPLSNEVSVTPTDTTAPAPPTLLSAVAGNGLVTLTWASTNAPDFNSYLIYGGTTPNPAIIIDTTFLNTDTVSVVSSLVNGVPHYFTVSVKDTSANIGLASNELSATPYEVYTVNASVFGNGTISPVGTSNVNGGDSILYTFVADSNNHIDSVLVDSVNIGVASNYAFTNVSADHAIDVYISLNQFTISTNIFGDGTVAPFGTTSVYYNDSLAISIAAN
ncbi:MAG: LamG-like jellyroll fold domain-containing protein, partial [Bacteriovoracaceae bacterium]